MEDDEQKSGASKGKQYTKHTPPKERNPIENFDFKLGSPTSEKQREENNIYQKELSSIPDTNFLPARQASRAVVYEQPGGTVNIDGRRIPLPGEEKTFYNPSRKSVVIGAVGNALDRFGTNIGNRINQTQAYQRAASAVNTEVTDAKRLGTYLNYQVNQNKNVQTAKKYGRLGQFVASDLSASAGRQVANVAKASAPLQSVLGIDKYQTIDAQRRHDEAREERKRLDIAIQKAERTAVRKRIIGDAANAARRDYTQSKEAYQTRRSQFGYDVAGQVGQPELIPAREQAARQSYTANQIDYAQQRQNQFEGANQAGFQQNPRGNPFPSGVQDLGFNPNEQSNPVRVLPASIQPMSNGMQAMQPLSRAAAAQRQRRLKESIALGRPLSRKEKEYQQLTGATPIQPATPMQSGTPQYSTPQYQTPQYQQPPQEPNGFFNVPAQNQNQSGGNPFFEEARAAQIAALAPAQYPPNNGMQVPMQDPFAPSYTQQQPQRFGQLPIDAGSPFQQNIIQVRGGIPAYRVQDAGSPFGMQSQGAPVDAGSPFGGSRPPVRVIVPPQFVQRKGRRFPPPPPAYQPDPVFGV